MGRALLTGADGAVGPRVARALEARGHDVGRAPDDGSDADGPPPGAADRVGPHRVVDCVDVVVDLGSSDYDRLAARRRSTTEHVLRTLELADRLGARQVVFVSSALVYGAHDNNPVPLTEEAVLRPSFDFVFARQLATAEELVEQWRRDVPGRRTAVLRPAVALAAGTHSQLTAALVAGLGQQFAQDDPSAQFLHLDDLAEAVAVAVDRTLDGVYNVAPDGWVPGARVRALSGERPRIPLPEWFNEVVVRWRWRLLRGPIPPGLLPYARNSWVVSNGRLRAEGWAPTVTNEQAYVEGTDAPWWSMVSPRRRQELALGGGAALFAIIGAVAAVIGVRWWRRRR